MENTREEVVNNDNMLSVQYLQLRNRVLMASQQVVVASKRVGVASKVVAVASQQVPMRYVSMPEPALKPFQTHFGVCSGAILRCLSLRLCVLRGELWLLLCVWDCYNLLYTLEP